MRAFATDPTSALRRHHRVQPAGRRRDARGRRRAVPRGADRARVHGRCARGDRAEEERARARGAAARRAVPGAARLEARRRRPARADGGRAQRAPTELRVVTRKAPTPAQLDDLLFAWRVAKFVKSNAIVYCAGRPHARHRRRPDEPRRLDADRGDEGEARGPVARGIGRRVRRVLPVPRRARRRRRQRRDGGDPARAAACATTR